jgi:hypothetical protein
MTLYSIESSPVRSDTTVLYLLRSRHQYRQRHRREIDVLIAYLSFVLYYFSEFRTRNLPPFHQVWDLFYMMSCSRLAVGSDLSMQSQCALRNANQIVESLIVDCPIVRGRSTCGDTWMANTSEFQMRSRSHPLDRDKGRLRGGRLEAHRGARLSFRGLSRRA